MDVLRQDWINNSGTCNIDPIAEYWILRSGGGYSQVDSFGEATTACICQLDANGIPAEDIECNCIDYLFNTLFQYPPNLAQCDCIQDPFWQQDCKDCHNTGTGVFPCTYFTQQDIDNCVNSDNWKGDYCTFGFQPPKCNCLYNIDGSFDLR